jgi:FkbM family methyltransferase
MVIEALEKLRQWLGYRFPPLGPAAFKFFRSLSKGKSIQSRFFQNLTVPIDFSDTIQSAAYWRGSRYEKPTPQLICKLTGEHKLSHFFDIGANFGFFSYYVKSSIPAVHVFAFEPGPLNYSKMMQVKEINSLTGFDPQNIGLGDTNSNLTFNLTLSDSGHSTFGTNPLYSGDPSMVKQIQVEVKKFDDWRREKAVPLPNTPKWIAKIDVEGFELKALQGMTEALKTRAFKALCIEINYHTLGFFSVQSTQIFDFMRSFGYEAFDENLQRTAPLNGPEMRNVFFILI